MRSGIVVRAARAEDAAALAQIQVDSYRTAYAGLLPAEYLAHFTYAEQTQDWLDLLAGPGTDLLMVAERADELIGYVLGRAGPTLWPTYDAEIVALHVRRAEQRQGVGRRLLAVLAGELRQAGCTAAVLSVLEGNSARAFYHRLGGIELGRQQVELGDDHTAVEIVYGWSDIAALCA